MDETKSSRAVAAILKSTQGGSTKWTTSAPTRNARTGLEDNAETVFWAELNKRHLRLYEYTYKSYTDIDEWHWCNDIALELSNEELSAWWRFPRNPMIWDLLNAVKYKVVAVDDFIDDLLDNF